MTSKPKPNKLKARLPRGLSDRGPAEIAATRRMIEKIRDVYERYGFEPVETPAFEYTDALGKFLPDQDRPNEGVFSFQDDDEQWLSLRYDLTAPLARYVAENFQALALPYRSYRYGWVFRNEKPGPGRFRQFMQFDADTVGSASPAADAEMCMMAADTMEALGIPRGSYVVKVNNRKVLDGVLESISLGGEENAGRRLTVLRAIDKLDRLGPGGVRELLGEGRWDGGEEGKGDFTKGAELSREQIDRLMIAFVYRPTPMENVEETTPGAKYFGEVEGEPWFVRYNNRETLQGLHASLSNHGFVTEGLAELEQLASLAEGCGFDTQRIKIDVSVVRGLEYYTGPVFEVELTFPIEDEDGKPVRFGSVGGGGRYDGLVARFRGEPVPATGFSIGVSRLLAALKHLGKVEDKPAPGPVVVTVFDRDRIADYQRMVQELRSAPVDPNKPDGRKIRAELYLGNPKNIPNQFKYADRRHSPCVIIQGGDEKNNPAGPQVVVKDLIVGAELAKLEKGREEHLQRQAEAQRLVPEDQLVDAVRAVLARHKVTWE
ncbi:MAG TPA: histidine--tRNA ligase [Rhodoplanes sp.]|nr:histidine--tRNA ligase [Rhodoplanes sp.]